MRNPRPSDNPAAFLKGLAADAQRGNRSAFTQLLRHLEPGIRRVMLRRTRGQAELVDELLQNTWVAVWHALREGRYDPKKAAISTFVYAVAHKLWLQHLRRARQAPVSYGELDAFLAAATEGPDNPAATLQAAELLDAVRTCLHAEGTPFSLTEEERRIVVGLARDQSERTLAEQLGVAASTIHARKQLAYRKLRRCLHAKGFSSEGAERSRPQRE
jgi:RNA polymerase sigma factor (sigma-70 family)